ncbi:MAG TPA: hypothetical protein DIW17_11465 [Clostridiales bacterium]|nr:hypothetical protein [Clostridia bacterium]MDD4679380.1 hypothetical protein [Clostridia bacterium]HCS74476.1 hypothetical protein [Clostridiales bacterium]
MDYEMYDSESEDANVVLNKLIKMCLTRGIPKEILVQSETLVSVLDDFCNKIGINLKIVEQLDILEETIEFMANR